MNLHKCADDGQGRAGERDLNIVHAASLVRVTDRGGPRRGVEQGELDILHDGAMAIRDGVIVGVGTTEAVLREHGDDVAILDATGRTVLPGLVECHSHPLFVGERSHELGQRIAGASIAQIAAAGGGIMESVEAFRAASDDALLESGVAAYADILCGGVTTLEVKSGYGLTLEEELRCLRLLDQSRAYTPMELVTTFLGAHVTPPEASSTDAFIHDVAEHMLPAVVASGLADFHDVVCEVGLFTSAQADRLLSKSRELGIATRVHADTWTPSQGWETAVRGGAHSADHLTYTPPSTIRDIGQTDCVAVVMPMAELTYLCEGRANARVFVDSGVPLGIATDYSSSIHATSLLTTLAIAAPWFRLTPAEVLVAGTLNAAYSLGRGHDRGSLDVGKRGDVLILDVPRPDAAILAVGRPLVAGLVAGGSRVL